VGDTLCRVLEALEEVLFLYQQIGQRTPEGKVAQLVEGLVKMAQMVFKYSLR
jgi:hypothetical protein